MILRNAILDRQVAEHAGLRQLGTTQRALAFEVALTYNFSDQLRLQFNEFFSNLLGPNEAAALLNRADSIGDEAMRATHTSELQRVGLKEAITRAGDTALLSGNIASVSAIVAMLAFTAWYFKHQRHQDRLIAFEAEKAELEVQRLKREAASSSVPAVPEANPPIPAQEHPST